MHYAVLVDDNKAEEFSPDTQQVTQGVTGARRLMYAFANGGQKEMRSICPWSGIRDYASVADDFSSASGL